MTFLLINGVVASLGKKTRGKYSKGPHVRTNKDINLIV